jgi:hypothetical protein
VTGMANSSFDWLSALGAAPEAAACGPDAAGLALAGAVDAAGLALAGAVDAAGLALADAVDPAGLALAGAGEAATEAGGALDGATAGVEAEPQLANRTIAARPPILKDARRSFIVATNPTRME